MDGIWSLGDTAILFDDVITGANSKLEALNTLRAAKIHVKLVMVLTNRQQGGEEQLNAAGLTLRSVFTLDELLKFYVEKRLVTTETFEEIMRYRAM